MMAERLGFFMQKNDDEFQVTIKKRYALAGMVIALLIIGEEGRHLVAKLIRSLFP